MLPTWMIEELEKQRREREMEQRPGLHVDVPVFEPQPRPEEAEPLGGTVIVIEIL
jgi:hypothetical protein